MAFKFVVLCALVACANAGAIGYAAPLAYAAAPAHLAPAAIAYTKTIDPEYDPHPQYSYSYGVQDSLTGDFKNQHETRDGDVVHGSYSLLEADGTKRIVDYTADPINGFNAIVRKEPAAALAVKTVAAAPIAYAPAPTLAYKTYAAPALAYSPAYYH